MITKYSIDCVEALALDHLIAGLPQKEVLKELVDLRQRCLDKELYENIREIERVYWLVEAL